MNTLMVVVHHPHDQILRGMPTQFGGKFEFMVDKEAVSLPRQVLRAIEVAHQSLAEFFPVKTAGGLTLDYVLIPQGSRLTEVQVARMRSSLIASISKILESLMNSHKVQVQQAAPS